MAATFRVTADRITSLTVVSGERLVATLAPTVNGGWRVIRLCEPVEPVESFAAGVWRLKQLAGRDAKWSAYASFIPTTEEVDLAADANACGREGPDGRLCHRTTGHSGEHWY